MKIDVDIIRIIDSGAATRSPHASDAVINAVSGRSTCRFEPRVVTHGELLSGILRSLEPFRSIGITKQKRLFSRTNNCQEYSAFEHYYFHSKCVTGCQYSVATD